MSISTKARKKLKDVQVVKIKNQDYFVNELPEEYYIRDNNTGGYDAFLVYEKFKDIDLDTICIYFHKNLEAEYALNDALSFWDGIKQPTESEVRNGMIVLKDKDYAIKAGGGSGSDNMFESSFRIEIANPKTGEDMYVTVLKKYSKVFEKVLITRDEIEKLFEACMSPKQVEDKRKNNVYGICHILYRNETKRPVTVYGHGGKRLVKKQEIKDHLIFHLVRQATENEVVKEFELLQKALLRDSKIEFVQPEATIKNKKECLDNIEVIKQLTKEVLTFFK